MRLATIAALLMLLTLLLPWYKESFFDTKTHGFEDKTFAGFGSADFVLASIVVVALGVLALSFFRGEKRGFHLPGGDGLVILVAAAWTGFLTFYRIVSPISVHDPRATIGLQWGVFVSFLASALLAVAGYRIRAAHRPEPPLPIDAPTASLPRRRARPPGPDDPAIPGQLAFDEAETQVSREPS